MNAISDTVLRRKYIKELNHKIGLLVYTLDSNNLAAIMNNNACQNYFSK